MKRVLTLSLLAMAIMGTLAFQTAPLRRTGWVQNHKIRPLIQSSQRKNPSALGQVAPSVLSSSSTSDDEGNSADDETTKLVQEYQSASIAYAITVGFMLLRHGVFNIDVLYSATGPFLGASLAYILKGAAENDRLSSDTYKRLGLFALEYAACSTGIVATLLIRAVFTGKFPSAAYGLFGVANALALVPAYKGFKSGVGDDKDLVKEVWEGTKNSAKGLFTCKNANAIGYLVGTWFFGAVKLVKLIEILYRIKAGQGVVAIGARVARFAKLAVLTGIMYTLKDAADRERLEGTTFIQLNFVASAVLASMAAYWYEGLFDLPMYIASFFCAFTGANGLKSVLKKREKSEASS